MSEKEFSKYAKNTFIAILTAAILAIGGVFFTSWQAGIKNTQRLDAIEKTQDAQKVSLEEKASLPMVKAVKENLEQKIEDKFDIIDGKLDVIMKLSPTYNNTYYENSKIKE